MHKNRGGVGGEGRAETIYVAKVEVSRPGDIIDVRFEGK